LRTSKKKTRCCLLMDFAAPHANSSPAEPTAGPAVWSGA
jgi:hypothetical protein